VQATIITVRRTLILVAAACMFAVLPVARATADPVVYAAGDVACDPADPAFNGGLGTATACRQRYTADLMPNGTFDAVMALGDLQYNAATLANFQQSYDLSWGRVKALTRPVIGNHEGTSATSGAGYCSYFGPAAHCNASGLQGGAAFYSFDAGPWHVVVLNSNCAAAGGCDAGSPQYQWLAGDLAASPRACTLAAWHHPRWSSGHDGSNAFMQPIWKLFYDSGGDLVLSGHSHDYERFAPIDGDGAVNPSNGMRSFVVGTGGVYFTGLDGAAAPGSEVRQNTTFGVLRLVLHPTSYDWTFLSESGRPFTDSGTQTCRGSSGAGPQPPGGAAPGVAPAAGGAASAVEAPAAPLNARQALLASSATPATASGGPAVRARASRIRVRITAVRARRGGRSVIVRVRTSRPVRARVSATMRVGGRRGKRLLLRVSAVPSLRSVGTVGLRLSQRQQRLLRTAVRAGAGRHARLSVTVTWNDQLGTRRARTKRTVLLRP
jgi:hypothetical protein